MAGLWRRFLRLSILVRLIIGAMAAAIVIGLVVLAVGSTRGRETAVRSPAASSTPPPATSTTTALVLPAGDDKTVLSVIDGDSVKLTDDTTIRLIGIDAPDAETRRCFSGEATRQLGQLLPSGSTVRVVYDASRTDRFKRTLAYVYRLLDGLFVNAAAARDGFAIPLTTPPNTAHADEIEAAAADAASARRGLWQACPTATTVRRRTTTTAPARVTTTTSPSAPTTASPTTAPA